MLNLLERISTALTPSLETSDTSPQRALQDRISGALGECIRVKAWSDGTLRVLVPVQHLTACGVTVVESAIAGRLPVVTGTAKAVSNAERRMAKLSGAEWSAKLVDFDTSSRRAVFEVVRAAPQT